MNCRNYELMNVCHKSDEYRDADFNARKMCCHCGGGTTGRGIYISDKILKKILVKYGPVDMY